MTAISIVKWGKDKRRRTNSIAARSSLSQSLRTVSKRHLRLLCELLLETVWKIPAKWAFFCYFVANASIREEMPQIRDPELSGYVTLADSNASKKKARLSRRIF
jgi:hypothetical protein